MLENRHTFANQDGLNIFYHEWLPDTGDNPDIVMIVHGHGEHSGRYRHVAESLTAAGLACYGIDHQGFGESGGLQGYLPDMQLAVHDIRQLVDRITAGIEREDRKRVLVFGHSMGTLIALLYTLQYQPDVKGLALSATAINGEDLQPSLVVALFSVLSSVIPKSYYVQRDSPAVLSTNPGIHDNWNNDPLTYKGQWRLGTSRAMLQAARDLKPRMSELRVPLYMIHGGADELAPASGATYIKDNAQSEDVTLTIYDGLRHELINEIGKDQIIQELTQWLVRHA